MPKTRVIFHVRVSSTHVQFEISCRFTHIAHERNSAHYLSIQASQGLHLVAMVRTLQTWVNINHCMCSYMHIDPFPSSVCCDLSVDLVRLAHQLPNSRKHSIPLLVVLGTEFLPVSAFLLLRPLHHLTNRRDDEDHN